MKWIFYVILFVDISYGRVSADESVEVGVEIEKIGNDDGKFFVARTHKEIICKDSTKNERVEWHSPSGDVVKPMPRNRIYVKDHFVKHPQSATREKMLIFTEILVQDSGIWQCRSGDRLKNISICVLDPVVFDNTQEEWTVDKGRSITLTCKTGGDPEPKMTWYRNGEIIAGDDNSTKYKMIMKYQTEGFEGFLTIISLEPEDSGVYTCVASQENQLVDDCTHSASYNITLNVNYGPIFGKEYYKSTIVFASFGERVELKCDAKGYPAPTYRWFHEYGYILSEIDENGNRSAFFFEADNETIGQKFKCQAANLYGISYKHFTVLLLEKPKKPTGISLLNCSADTMEFKVTWPDNKVLFPIDSFEFQFKVLPGTNDWDLDDSITISDLKSNSSADEFYVSLPDLDAETEYRIRLRAVNRAGHSEWSEYFIANTTASHDVKQNYTTTRMNDFITLYGILFGVAIIIVAIICIFAVKKL